jgi:precorrin-3B C17-methyltransferase
MSAAGKLYLVSVGPGFAELIPPMAQRALQESEVIVGYDLYLKWIKPWIAGKEIHTMPLTRERERATKVIECARSGRSASLVSSGDIGVYAMAALVLDEMREEDAFELKIIPGISAANSCASLLGSPLSHDFATLSLSDLLCPWEWIEHRARHLARADMVTALYNVQSRTREDGVYCILRLMLEHKSPGTWCGVVKNAYREGEEIYVRTLSELLDCKFDMLTTIIVGNRFTRRKREFIYTPRGYNAWNGTTEKKAEQEVATPPAWVFSGTSDGNALAAELARNGYNIIVSTASEYGRELVAKDFPGLPVRSGRIGMEARRRELQQSSAAAIVDATHPFAAKMSAQLITLSQELGIPYLRYERPAAQKIQPAIHCETMEAAAAEAIKTGRRIFLATGTKELATFVNYPRTKECEWFVRVAPDPDSLERALSLGIPRAHLCAMQGPFSKEFNETLWRSWKIDCVVTKDSGDAGGFIAKADAASALEIPLIVVERPQMQYPRVSHDFATIASFLEKDASIERGFISTFSEASPKNQPKQTPPNR